MGIKNVVYLQPNVEAAEMEEFKRSLGNFSTTSTFESDIWVFDKLKKGANSRASDVSLYFSKINDSYLWHLKVYLLQRLNKGISFGSLNSQHFGLSKFFEFIGNNYSNIRLEDLDKHTITAFELHLRENGNYSKSSKEAIWSSINGFFKTMSQVEGMPKQKITSNMNPFSRTSSDRMVGQKFVPLEIMDKLDLIFKNESMEHHIRTIYWICRLIPSRINEVTTIPIDALKLYRENEYTLTLHMYKQNGGYMRPEPRIIHLKNEDMGGYTLST